MVEQGSDQSQGDEAVDDHDDDDDDGGALAGADRFDPEEGSLV